ncbi:hypothetical protein OAR36_07275 [Pseudomonadales bacterium]|nr:hypothetical protein [Pseudomonadales bacterium]
MVIKANCSNIGGLSLGLLFALTCQPIYGESVNNVDNSMEAYVTCAVYHRMMAGSFTRVRQMPELAGLESEKMNEHIRLAKVAGRVEFGGTEAVDTEIDTEVEAVFSESWKYNLNQMENKINRNYENVSRLTYIYKNRCRKLLE